MLDQRWYDKIAAATADAEAAVIDAAAQDAAAEDESLIAKIQEDIQIAQEVAAADLPTDVKVEILENQGVEPEIIDEVIDADATDAVAAYYGVDPYWLHDKRAGAAAEAAKSLARKATPAAKKALNAAKGLTNKADTWIRQNPFEAGIAAGATMGGAGMAINKLRGKDKESAYSRANPYIDDKTAAFELNPMEDVRRIRRISPANRLALGSYMAAPYAGMGLGGLAGAGLGYLAGGTPGAVIGGLGGAGLGGALGAYYSPELSQQIWKAKVAAANLKGMDLSDKTAGMVWDPNLGSYVDAAADPTLWQRIKNAAGKVGNWAMAHPYAAGAAGLGALGLGALGYAGYNAYQNQLAEEEAAQQAAMYGLGGGAGLGGIAGAGLGYLAGGMPGAIAGGLGGAALGGAAGYYGVPMGMDYLNNAAASAEAEEAPEVPEA